MPAKEPRPGRQVGLSDDTDSRWGAIWQLVLSAEQLPAGEREAFLKSANTDPFIIRQAVAIFEGSESLATVASSPSLGPEQRFIPQTGMKIGRYRVGTILGSGGAGSVYSAYDEELNRPVAMKFVSSPCSGGSDAAELSLREARAASALNHPNIIMIHEVIETTGENTGRTSAMAAIVMELVQGHSLAHFRGTLLPINEVLSIAAQISKALAAAHAHSIIHGDIKPENIMLRDDGYVKVLDFGLARRAAVGTTAGAHGPVFGTLRYMSPEQARGESLTPASDIFSFGLVLFELAAGRRAFDGASQLDAVRATLTLDPPAPASVNPQVPTDLNALVLAMLAKDPHARPLASGIARQLEDKVQAVGGRVTPGIERPQKSLGRWLWVTALVISITVLTAGWFLFVRQESARFTNLRIQPLTSQAGWEASPAISPDGNSVAFTWTERADAPPQIYVKQVNDTAPIRLTDSQSEGRIGSVVWSPDGNTIAFMRQTKGLSSIFVISKSGGNEKKILDTTVPYLSARIDWSPDGTELAFSDMLPASERLAIFLFNFRTGKQRQLTSPPSEATGGDWNPRFSPDGRTVAFKRVTGFWADDMYTVPVAGGEPRRVTHESRGIWGHAWMPDGNALILSCQRGTTIFGLWRVPLTSQSLPEPIIQGGFDAITPATSRKPARLAWTNQIQDVNIYRVSVAGGEQAVRLIGSTLRDQHPAYSSRSLIAFVSDRSGSREIWLSRADGTGQKRITTFNGPDVGDLQWSPDGRYLAFYGRAHGDSDIFVLDCDPANMLCGSPERITSGIRAEVPSWSADGRAVYFASDQTGGWEVWKKARSGGKPLQVTQNGGYASRESRDGNWLYFSKNRSEAVWRTPISRSDEQAAVTESLVVGPPNHVQQKGWTLTPDGIVFTERAREGQPSTLRAYDFSTARTRVITSMTEGFEGNREYGVSVSTDARWLLYSQLDRSGSNIMVADIPSFDAHDVRKGSR